MVTRGERSRLSSAVWIIVVVFADEGGGLKRCWVRSVSIAGVGIGMGPRVLLGCQVTTADAFKDFLADRALETFACPIHRRLTEH